jgi:hypothetical protein
MLKPVVRLEQVLFEERHVRNLGWALSKKTANREEAIANYVKWILLPEEAYWAPRVEAYEEVRAAREKGVPATKLPPWSFLESERIMLHAMKLEDKAWAYRAAILWAIEFANCNKNLRFKPLHDWVAGLSDDDMPPASRESLNMFLDCFARTMEGMTLPDESATLRRNRMVRLAIPVITKALSIPQTEACELVSNALFHIGMGVDAETIRKEILPEQRSKRRPKRQPKRKPVAGQIK